MPLGEAAKHGLLMQSKNNNVNNVIFLSIIILCHPVLIKYLANENCAVKRFGGAIKQ